MCCIYGYRTQIGALNRVIVHHKFGGASLEEWFQLIADGASEDVHRTDRITNDAI